MEKSCGYCLIGILKGEHSFTHSLHQFTHAFLLRVECIPMWAQYRLLHKPAPLAYTSGPGEIRSLGGR